MNEPTLQFETYSKIQAVAARAKLEGHRGSQTSVNWTDARGPDERSMKSCLQVWEQCNR